MKCEANIKFLDFITHKFAFETYLANVKRLGKDNKTCERKM